MRLPDCMLGKKRVLTEQKEFIDPTPTAVIPRPVLRFKEQFDAGLLTALDFPGDSIPAGARYRWEAFCECGFEDDDGAEIVLSEGCVLRKVRYRCDPKSRLTWLHPRVEVNIQPAPSNEAFEAFEVRKRVLLCADGSATVLSGVEPIPKTVSAPGSYDPALDTHAGEDCAPCNCATLTAAQTDFNPAETLPVSQGAIIEQPTQTASTKLLYRYWRLVPPRRRNGPCTEKNTYKLVECDITINRITGQVDFGQERDAKPPQVQEFLQVIPGCFPSAGPLG